MICVTQCWWKVKQSFVALLVHHKTNFSRLLFHSPRSFTVPRVEHRVSIFRASRDARLGEGQLVALHPGPHPGHHHHHELPGRPSRSGLRRPPPVLHLLLQRPVIALLHHPGELQLRTVRRPQAQGQTEPTALLHRGVRGEETQKKKKKETGEIQPLCGKKTSRYFLHFLQFTLVSVYVLVGAALRTTRTTRMPLLNSTENCSCLEDVARSRVGSFFFFLWWNDQWERDWGVPRWIVPLRGRHASKNYYNLTHINYRSLLHQKRSVYKCIIDL